MKPLRNLDKWSSFGLFIHHFNRSKLRNSTPGFLNTSTAKFTMFSNIFVSRQCGKNAFLQAGYHETISRSNLGIYLAHGFEITIGLNDTLCCKDFRHLWLING